MGTMFFSQKNKKSEPKFDNSKLFPMVLKLGQYLKTALDHYVMVKAAGKMMDVDMLSVFVEMKMATWNPQLNKKELLDNDTRKAAARFIAGIVCNFTKDET